MNSKTIIAIAATGLLMSLAILLFGGAWDKYLILLAVFILGVLADKWVIYLEKRQNEH